jgi:hypothetical protein
LTAAHDPFLPSSTGSFGAAYFVRGSASNAICA